jgi:hypothetical protein
MIDSERKLTVDLALTFQAKTQEYSREFELGRELGLADLGYCAAQMFRECHMHSLYSRYRRAISNFQSLFQGENWFPDIAHDLVRTAAHNNTAQTWFQIRNTFLEAAHLMAQARAYKDVESSETDQEQRLLTHLMKLQFFNSAVFLICKVEDWFLLLVFVNSGCSLIAELDVHQPDWMKGITRGAIDKGLRNRKSGRICARSLKTNPYLDALSDDEYRTTRSVFKKLGRPNSVRSIRDYRNEIAHRGLPPVDYAFFSPTFQFPKITDRSVQLSIATGTKVDHQFLDLYQHACDALRHLEAQLLKIKAIPVLEPR